MDDIWEGEVFMPLHWWIFSCGENLEAFSIKFPSVSYVLPDDSTHKIDGINISYMFNEK